MADSAEAKSGSTKTWDSRTPCATTKHQGLRARKHIAAGEKASGRPKKALNCKEKSASEALAQEIQGPKKGEPATLLSKPF